MRAKWQADDPDAFAAQEERRSSWRRANRGGMVACGVVAGRGELSGSSSVGDGHAGLPRALAVRAIHDDPAVSSDGGLLVQRAHSELAASVVEHSVAIRVTSFEDLQLVSTRCALQHLLRICKAYDVVVDIWVPIPCTAGTHFRRINELGDFALTHKLVVAAVGLYRHDVRIGDGFSWKWSNGIELWKLVVVRSLREVWQLLLFGLNRSCETAICRSRGSMFCVKKKWKIVMAPYARSLPGL